MFSLRAPLFSVSLVFATGCLLGLESGIPWAVTGFFGLAAGLGWLMLARRERVSLAAFYTLIALGGWTYTLLAGSTVAPDDLRRLPEEKTLDTTQWRGLVVEEPEVPPVSKIKRRSLDRITFVLRMEAWRPTGGRFFAAEIPDPWQAARGDVRCTLIGKVGEIRCGDRIAFAAALLPVTPPLCPGELDYSAWEAAQGIYYHVTVPSQNWNRVETGSGYGWENLSFRARDWAYDRLQLGLEADPRMADFLAGMLIGYRQQIPVDIEQDFRRTGTLHVFAVSGQNIAEMVVVALVLLQLCGLVRWRWAWTFAPVVLLYCLLTGSPSSAIRATIMALAILLAWRLGRPLNALGCWALAFLAMLIWNPSMLLDPGAQLSFGVVLGLILLGPPLSRLLGRPFQPDPFLPESLLTPAQSMEKRFWWIATRLVGTSIAATVVSEPITALDFHQVTPISILANLVVVPVAGLITMIGTLSVTLSLLSTQLAALLNNTNWLLARGLIAFVGFLAHEPGAAINVPDLRTLGTPTPSFLVAPWQDSASLLVRTGTDTWLVNTGRETTGGTGTGRMLQFYGINRLEGLVMAQMSIADNGGAERIAQDFQPRRVVVSVLKSLSPLEKTVPAIVTESGGRLESWQRGESRELAPGVRVEVLGPEATQPASHAEDRALILLFQAAGQTLLWAGKMGLESQAELQAAYPDLHADVLVMGTEPPPSRAWLEALGVRYWLQIPPRDRQVNSVSPALVPEGCQVWRLNETGAVDVYFEAGSPERPPACSCIPGFGCQFPGMGFVPLLDYKSLTSFDRDGAGLSLLNQARRLPWTKS